MHPSLTRDRLTQERWNIFGISSFQLGVVLIREHIEARVVILGQSALGRWDAGVDLDSRMRHLGGSDPLECSDFTDDTTRFPRDRFGFGTFFVRGRREGRRGRRRWIGSHVAVKICRH
jgi:hypothetical protein